MSCEVPTAEKTARRAYRRDMLVAAGLYVGVTAISVYLTRHYELPPLAAALAALAPVGPVLLVVRGYLTFVRALDEVQRAIQTESMLIALAVVALGSFAYGFLEELANFPHLPLIWILPAIILVWVAAKVFVRRRYQ